MTIKEKLKKLELLREEVKPVISLEYRNRANRTRTTRTVRSGR